MVEKNDEFEQLLDGLRKSYELKNDEINSINKTLEEMRFKLDSKSKKYSELEKKFTELSGKWDNVLYALNISRETMIKSLGEGGKQDVRTKH